MKAFVSILLLFVAAQAADDYCYMDTLLACSPRPNKQGPQTLDNCNAKYGAITQLEPSLQAYVNSHITNSFEYLLMATHYANYLKNRPGFEKVFRELSNYKWDKAIDLIKHITKRGGVMDFNQRDTDSVDEYELYELSSLAKALDIEKRMATKAFDIHRGATRKSHDSHDPEISDYIEEEFVHKQADTVRKLAGYTSDLNSLLRGPDSTLALYLFDQYLEKQ